MGFTAGILWILCLHQAGIFCVFLWLLVLYRYFKRKDTHLCIRWEQATVVPRKDSLFLVINNFRLIILLFLLIILVHGLYTRHVYCRTNLNCPFIDGGRTGWVQAWLGSVECALTYHQCGRLSSNLFLTQCHEWLRCFYHLVSSVQGFFAGFLGFPPSIS